MSSQGSQGGAGDEGTDPLVRPEEADASLEEPTRLARPGATLPAGDEEDTVTRTGRLPVDEDTVVRGRGGEAGPAEPTWSDPEEAAPEAPVADTVALDEPVGLAEAPQLRLLPAGRPAERRARRQEVTRRLRPEAPEELPPPPAPRRAEGPPAPAPAEATTADGAPAEARWGWWLLGVLGATLWLAIAGALGWWAADRELAAGAGSATEIVQPER